MNFDEIFNSSTVRLALKRWPLLVVSLVVSFFLAMLTYALVPQWYHVTATVVGTRYQSDITPSNQTATFSASALLGGTANDLPAITDFRLYTQLLTSPELGASIIDEPIIHRVFSNSWVGNRWVPPNTLTQRAKQMLFSLMGRNSWSEPDGFTVANYLENHVVIVSGKDAKILTMSTWNRDPDLGKQLLQLVSQHADRMVKQLAQRRFRAKVKFLEKALSGADVQETRTALGQALAKAETDEIYSLSDLPFAAEFLELPGSPKRPQFPRFELLLGVFLALGAITFSLYIARLKKKSIAVQ